MATKKKTTAPVLTDPNAIYQQLAAMPMGGATPLDQTYADAVTRYRKASDATYVLPDVLKSYLGGVSPAYTQDKAAVLAQFADKNSPLYISNPFARLQAAQAAQQGQKQTFDQVLERTSRLVGMGVSQQQQNVSDLGNQVQSAQQAQKDQRSALQQQFNNALNLAQEARARASAGTKSGAPTPEDLAEAKQWTQYALNWAKDNPDTPFDISVIPASARGAFISEWNALTAGVADDIPVTEAPKFDRATGTPISTEENQVDSKRQLQDVNRQLQGMSVMNPRYQSLVQQKRDLQAVLFGGQTISQAR